MVPQIPLFSRRFFHVLERFMKQTQEKDCLSKITGMMRSESKCDYITWYFFFSIPYFVLCHGNSFLDYLFDARTFSCET